MQHHWHALSFDRVYSESIQPCINFHLSRFGPQGQQHKQRGPYIPLPSQPLRLFRALLDFRFGDADSHPLCFTLCCQPLQCKLRTPARWSQQDHVIHKKKTCNPEATKWDPLGYAKNFVYSAFKAIQSSLSILRLFSTLYRLLDEVRLTVYDSHHFTRECVYKSVNSTSEKGNLRRTDQVK